MNSDGGDACCEYRMLVDPAYNPYYNLANILIRI